MFNGRGIRILRDRGEPGEPAPSADGPMRVLGVLSLAGDGEGSGFGTGFGRVRDALELSFK